MLKKIMIIVSWVSLVLLLVPSFLFLNGSMELDKMKSIMVAATIIWFISASYYMWNSDSAAE